MKLDFFYSALENVFVFYDVIYQFFYCWYTSKLELNVEKKIMKQIIFISFFYLI